MNTEKKTNRKEWVKNVAIIFLSVMLVLTFFSNTIMNYSLPEVATAMIEPGSITAKIRGTGNLTSDDPYKITIQESRKIASVAVKQGDVVEKDQVLFYLEDEDSAELEQAEKDYNEALEKFYNRARIMYQYTQFDSLKLFVESKDFFDFTNRDKLFSRMMENDRKALEELNIMKEDLEAKKAVQEKLKLDAEALVKEKEAVIAAIENEEEVILGQLEESQDALGVLESQEEAMLEESDKIAAEIRALEKEYQKRLEEEKKNSNSSPSSTNRPSYDDGGSGLLWPSRCTKISSYFGMRLHPIYHYYKMHKGIDIGASYGTDIYASEDGIVTNVSYNKGGYGWYIVVYHGDGLSTLYAHCSKVIAEEGQYVSRGQVIALVGSTGASTGPHIHYEVRENGDPVNPLNYVSP